MPDNDIAQLSADTGGPSPPAQKNGGFAGSVLMFLLGVLPVLFGVGFIAPLIAQLLERGLPGAAQAQWPLLVGLVVGGSWGLIANLRGRWI